MKCLIMTLKKISDMGVLGDIVRMVRDTTKTLFEECGGEDLIDEIKDIGKALKGD